MSFAWVSRVMGLPPLREIAARYARRAGVDLGAVDCYEAFAL
jgi:aminoglycoside phosphotransferase (APT) family kinase protein